MPGAPKPAAGVIAGIGLPTEHDYMSFDTASYDDTTVTVCRTGYTGERGYELLVVNDAAGELWDSIMEAGEEWGITACGLGAH